MSQLSYAEGRAALSPAGSDAVQLKPDIEATPEALGQHVVDGMNTANKGPYSLTEGIHYHYNYQSELERAGKASEWKEEYRKGHNWSGHFINPSATGRFMQFELKKGHSASAGIKAWLKGLTVAECLSSVVAMEIDAIRAAIGDDKFDKAYGSAKADEDAAVPSYRRLKIKAGTSGTPVADYVTRPELTGRHNERQAKGEELTEKDMEDLLKPGEWYYFYNHPKYLLKHPGGAWQGENAIYMGKKGGKRMWSGLGASDKTEDTMIEEMVDAYNGARDRHDERVMKARGIKNDKGEFLDKKYDPAGGEFEVKITKEKLLNDPAYSLNGRSRKGGFLARAGITLDAKKIKATADGS